MFTFPPTTTSFPAYKTAIAPIAKPKAPPPTTPQWMVGSCIAALGRTLAAELRTPPAPLTPAETIEEAELAPLAIPLEAAEATEPTEPLTPEAEAEAVEEAMLVMATELEREERAPPSREEVADGALMVVERDPEAD
jgi:hypothetical protein